MKCDRLSWDLLVRAVDNELSASETAWVSAHIAGCTECSREYLEIQNLSVGIESVVGAAPVMQDSADRERLAALKAVRQAPERAMRRFGWGMAIAATLALGIIFAPKPTRDPSGKQAIVQSAAGAAASNAIEVDGETFVALPYSNPDLPASTPRIVQMQVPVLSLASIGIGTDQVANAALNQDRTVLADVLLGADGQPLGVHVVSWE